MMTSASRQVCMSVNDGGGCGGLGLNRVLVGTFLVRRLTLSLSYWWGGFHPPRPHLPSTFRPLPLFGQQSPPPFRRQASLTLG